MNEWGGWGRRGPEPVKYGVCACALLGMGIWGGGGEPWGGHQGLSPPRACLPAVTIAAAAATLLLV